MEKSIFIRYFFLKLWQTQFSGDNQLFMCIVINKSLFWRARFMSGRSFWILIFFIRFLLIRDVLKNPAQIRYSILPTEIRFQPSGCGRGSIFVFIYIALVIRVRFPPTLVTFCKVTVETLTLPEKPLRPLKTFQIAILLPEIIYSIRN